MNEERKLVSVLFVDIVGSTARAYGADPEDIRDVLRRFHEPVRRQVELHGGVIEKFIGDAVVAVFGTPTAHGDDALRAVRCALRIAEAVEALNADDRSLQLGIRAGVATGEALVELGSDPGRGEAIAVGDVMNTAARIQSGAPAGGVAVGEETERATRRNVRYRALEPIAAKGIPEPVPVWQAVELAAEAGVQAPLVGRGDELRTLQAEFDAAVGRGEARIATVLGPPGIGKSRLVIELCAWAELQGAAVYRGRCLSYAERRAYQASVDQIQQIAGIFEADEPALARQKLAIALARELGPEAPAELTRPLSLLLGLGLDESMKAREPLFHAVRRLLDGLSAARPSVLVFEDMHWADESQLELLDYLAARLAGPALLLLTARPELAQHREPQGAVLELQPLADEAAGELAADLLGPAAADLDLAGLLKTAGGNPLFVEELTASLAHGGPGERMPVTVREAIAAHLDSLASDVRAVLLDAAVVGETFWRGVLAATGAGDDASLDGALDDLARRGLVRRSTHSRVEGDQQLSFKHVLVQEVAYSTLTRAARRERHAQVARYVEERVGPQARDLAPFLAHHWRAADQSLKAIDHLLIAAETAREAWAVDDLNAHSEAALALAGADLELRKRIRLQQALALVHLDEFATALGMFDELLPQLQPREELEVAMAGTFCAYWMEDTVLALRWAARGRELADQLGDPELRAVAAMYQGMPHEYTGDLGLLELRYGEARRLWVPGTRPSELATLNEYEADLWYWAGDYRRAEELARSAYEMGGTTHHLQAYLRGGGWRGLSLAAMGRSEEALAWLDDMFRAGQEVDPRWGAANLNYSSLPLRDMLRLREARQRNEHALELVASRGAWGMAELQAEIDLCLTDLFTGEPGRVQRDFDKLWDAAVNGKAWRPWLGGVRLKLVRAELARQTEEPAETARHASEAVERGVATRRRKYESSARAILGEALIGLGRTDDAFGEFRRSLAIADELGSPTPRWQLRLQLGRAAQAAGREAAAEAWYSEAAGIVRDYAKGLTPENSAFFLRAEPVRELLKLL